MDELLMDKVQLISWIIAMAAAVITALLAISNFKKSIRERKLDLRWKQASIAKEFVNEVHENKFSGAAIQMLDWFTISKTEALDKLEIGEINYEEILEAI